MTDIKLYNQDCMEILKGLPDNSIDLICTDIPYELEKHGGTKSALATRCARMRDSVEFMANGIDYESVFSEYLRVCKIPNMIIFCSNLQIGKIVSFFNAREVKTDVLVWEKSNPAPLCNGKYVSDLEYIIYVHSKGAHFNNNATFEEKHKCKHYPIMTGEKLHPTQKPLDLMKELINVHSFEGDVVLDTYMGSGTTGCACKELKRDFIGCEIDSNFFELAKKRIESQVYQMSLFEGV